MSHKVVITGYGMLSAVGDSPEHFFEALQQDKAYAAPPTSFETTGTTASVVAEVPDLDPEKYLGDVNHRPLNRTALLAVVAAAKALEHANCDAQLRIDANVGMVLGTMYCSVGTITAFDRNTLEVGPKYAKPMMFANTVINAAAGQTALWHDLRGPNTTVSCGAISGLAALGYAYDTIAQGRSSMLLAGGVEELCFESFHAFDQAGYLAADPGAPACFAPFDRNRQGCLMGEGAAFLMLESADSAQSRGVPVYGEIRGHASGFDPSQGKDETSAVAAMKRTIDLALTMAGIEAHQLDFVYASASGLPTDGREARVLAQVNDQVPVTAIKGCVGETLGASGPMDLIAALHTLKHGQLPGITGFQHAGPDFPLSGISANNRTIKPGLGLIHSLGLDGSCCAMVIASPELAP